MKSKLLLTCVMVAIVLSLVACSPKQASVEVPCDDFTADQHLSKEIEVAVDDSFTVTLCSNPTTGFEWELAEISDQAVLEYESQEFKAPAAGSPPGTGGQEIWTFKAVGKGTSTISMEYSRPWEGGEKGEWTFTLTVVVK